VPPAYRRQAIKFWKFLALWAGLPVPAQHPHLPLAMSFMQLAGKILLILLIGSFWKIGKGEFRLFIPEIHGEVFLLDIQLCFSYIHLDQ